MKGSFWKKLTAGALALLLVSGGVPMQPIAEYLSPAVTASAEEVAENVLLDLYRDKIDYKVYSDDTSNITHYTELNETTFSSFVGKLLGNGSHIWTNNNNTEAEIHLVDKDGSSMILTIEDGGNYTLTGVYKITSFSSRLSNDSSRRYYTIELTEVYATLTSAPQPNNIEGCNYVGYTGSPVPLVTAGTAVNGTVKYYLNTQEPDVEPSEEYSIWSDEVPTATDRGTYKVWYKVDGTDGYFGLGKQCIEVGIHNPYNEIYFDDTVPTGAVTVKTSNGVDVIDDQFAYDKPVEIKSTAKLDIKKDSTSEDFADAVEQIDYADEQYVYTFTMPDEKLCVSHTHSLRVYPGKNTVSDKFGVYCTNELTEMNTLYALSAESREYNATAAEATLTTEGNIYSDGLTVTNTPSVTYYDNNDQELIGAPTDVGTYTAKTVVNYTLGSSTASRTIEKKFTISQKDIRSDDVAVTITPDSQNYNGIAPTFTASVTINGEEVPAENYEYTVTPSGSAVGNYTVSFTGKNSMKGTRSVTFDIKEVNTTDNITVTAADKTYDAQEYSTDKITITGEGTDATTFVNTSTKTYAFAGYDRSKQLDEQAYTSEAPVNAGQYAVRVTMTLDNYVTVVKYAGFVILPREITDKDITREVDEKIYNTQAQNASVKLTYGGSELVEDEDFTITSAPQTNANAYYHSTEDLAQLPTVTDPFKPGDYTFTVEGTGNYTGTWTDSWHIKRRPIDVYGNFHSFECAVGQTATIQWIVDLDDSRAYFTSDDPDYKNDFAMFVDGTEQDMLSYKFCHYKTYEIILRGIGNYEGAVTTIKTPSKLNTYGLDFEYIPKEYDGNFITWADFKRYQPFPDIESEEETFFLTRTVEEYYGGATIPTGSIMKNISVLDIEGNIIPLDEYLTDPNDSYPGGSFVMCVAINTDTSKGLVCDGRSVGPNLVAYYSNDTAYSHINFTAIVYITKATAEHTAAVVEFAANDKTYDGLPYDCAMLTELFSNEAENKLAQEVIRNGTVVYSFAVVPDGYTGDYTNLDYTTNIPPTNAGHYAVKATTSGDNFEEVSFYDDFTIAKKAVTVTADDQTAVYLQDTLTPTATAEGAVVGDLYDDDWNALFRYDFGTSQKSILDANTPVGEYDIVADETMMNSTRYANYNITAVSAKATVNQYDLSQSGGNAATSATLTQSVFMFSAAPQSITENGNLTVTANNRTLTEGKDFTVSGDTPESGIGSYVLTLRGKGNFTGEITLPWKVVEQAVFIGSSASLGEMIELRFFVDENADVLSEAGAYIEFTANGATATSNLTEFDTQDGKRFYGVKTGSSHMTDEITARLCHANGTAVDVMTSTIASYAYDVKKKYPDNEKLNALIDDMLRYGTAAQLYKDYKTNDLPIKDPETAFTAYASDADVAALIDDSHRANPDGTSDGVTFLGQTASLGSDTTMRLVFKIEGDVGDYTFKVKDPETGDSIEKTPSKYEDYWSVDITGMRPGDYDTKYEVTVTNKDGQTVTVKRSLYGYIKSVLEGDYEHEKQLVKSMYYYNESADDYKASLHD